MTKRISDEEAARTLGKILGSGWRVDVVGKPAEDLTPEGIQLVIPGAEKTQPPSKRQLELF